MIKNNKLLFVIGGIGFIIMIYPSIYWMQNPELTQMQVFLEFWWLYAILFACFGTIVAYFTLKK